MGINTTALECFLAVVETKSFTKAAKRLGCTQSAISQQIVKLEKLIGKLLLVRGKNFSVTSHGMVFLDYARKIFSLHMEALDRFKEPDLQGEVRFGLPEDLASVFLSNVLTDFSSIHPRILLNVECDLTLNLFERFKKNQFDLVVLKMNHPEKFPNGLNVWSQALQWVGDIHLLDCPNKPVPLVLSPQPCVYRARAISSLQKVGKKWRMVFSSHSFSRTIAAVKAGLGITVLPKNMVPKDVDIIKPSKKVPTLDDTYVSLIKHQSQNAAINTFEEFVLQKLKS